MSPTRRVVVLLAAGHCLAMIDRNLLAAAATPVARAIGLRDGGMGVLLGAAFALPYAAAAMPLGRLADRGRPRLLLIGGTILWTLASLAIGVARTPAELAVARVVMGLGQAAFVPAALALLTLDTTGSQAGRLALFTGASSLGRGLALLVGGAILGALAGAGGAAWRWLFVVTAVPNLLLMVALIATGWPPIDRAVRPRPELSGTKALFLAAGCMPIVTAQAAIAWVPTLLVRQHAMTPAAAAMLAGSVALVAGPAGQLGGGWLARRFPTVRERPLATVALGLWSAVLLLLLTGRAPSPMLSAVALVGVNLTLGIAGFAALFGWQGLWAAGERGVGNGAYMAIVTLVGVGAGPALAGMMSEAAGGGAAALGWALVATGMAAAGLASLLALALGRTGTIGKAAAA